jgi:ATP-dependent helicase HrpB
VLANLPIYEVLPELKHQLAQHPTVIVQAPPGAGKSTVLPLELLDQPWLAGQILMLEPRRLAARSVAARMAALLSQEVGQTVGYRVRFEGRVSQQTRLEVLTEGILTRRLQHDPGLEGVGLVIFDEFHERSLQADLALALCREVQQALRSDLKLLLMSATLEGETLSTLLGNAPIISAAGRQYPTQLHYLPRDPEGPLPGTVAGAVSKALAQHGGDVLVFLPGVSEISRTQNLLLNRHPEIKVQPLYGDLSLSQQQEAILPDPARRKVVLATSIAETSLTIEGIRVVVDSGFSRVPRFDARSGLSRLETVRLTLDAADQRAGRAGRLGPGVCYRLWSQSTHHQLAPTRKAEILEADLAPLMLELAQWGVRDPSELNWITPPPAGAVRQAKELLHQLDALEDDVLTERGKAMLELPTHPRLAHLLIEGSSALATDIAALLEERDPLPRNSGSDLGLRVEALRHWREKGHGLHGADVGVLGRVDVGVLGRVERLAGQWRKHLGLKPDNSAFDPYQVGALLALAYPERIAQLRQGQTHRYRLSGGRGVRLPEDDPLMASPWLAVAHLDAGNDEGRIFLAAPVEPTSLAAHTAQTVRWDYRSGSLIAQQEQRIGELVLAAAPLASIPAEQRLAILCQVVQGEGLALLPWTEATRQWQARVQSLHRWRGDWPEVSDSALLERLEDWLGPWLERVNRREDFARLDLPGILSAMLPWALGSRLDALAPLRLTVPSGSQVKLTYSVDGSPPVLAVKLQELFGLADTPTVNEGRTRVMLHLLSPAQRPIQVTQDLHSFWNNTYPQIRKELRGRYNKHPWPEDPWNAVPTRKTNSK